MRSWPISIALVVLGAGTAFAQDELGRWEADRLGDHLGTSLAPLGDLAADAATFAAGAAQPGRASGYVWVLRLGAMAPVLEMRGLRFDDRFGTAVCALDDVDGDGQADLVVGAPGSDLCGRDAYASVRVSLSTSSLWLVESSSSSTAELSWSTSLIGPGTG